MEQNAKAAVLGCHHSSRKQLGWKSEGRSWSLDWREGVWKIVNVSETQSQALVTLLNVNYVILTSILWGIIKSTKSALGTERGIIISLTKQDRIMEEELQEKNEKNKVNFFDISFPCTHFPDRALLLRMPSRNDRSVRPQPSFSSSHLHSSCPSFSSYHWHGRDRINAVLA